jgi:predicted TPR repeat methyltransferase
MNLNKPDHFGEKAKSWDQGQIRVLNANKISSQILMEIRFSGSEHIMDFGAGTGLLSEGIAPHVSRITAVDYSSAMLEHFAAKSWPCETSVLNIDLSHANLEYEFDGIISSMTLHHIQDIPKLFAKFYKLIKPGGFIAFADLELEDGTFHSDNTGVEHFGFEPSYISGELEKVGFKNLKSQNVHEIVKELNGQIKAYPIFLVTAKK